MMGVSMDIGIINLGPSSILFHYVWLCTKSKRGVLAARPAWCIPSTWGVGLRPSPKPRARCACKAQSSHGSARQVPFRQRAVPHLVCGPNRCRYTATVDFEFRNHRKGLNSSSCEVGGGLVPRQPALNHQASADSGSSATARCKDAQRSCVVHTWAYALGP